MSELWTLGVKRITCPIFKLFSDTCQVLPHPGLRHVLIYSSIICLWFTHALPFNVLHLHVTNLKNHLFMGTDVLLTWQKEKILMVKRNTIFAFLIIFKTCLSQTKYTHSNITWSNKIITSSCQNEKHVLFFLLR